MIGGTGMQTLILLWSTFRTDWNKEVCIYSTKHVQTNQLLTIYDYTNLEFDLLGIVGGKIQEPFG